MVNPVSPPIRAPFQRWSPRGFGRVSVAAATREAPVSTAKSREGEGAIVLDWAGRDAAAPRRSTRRGVFTPQFDAQRCVAGGRPTWRGCPPTTPPLSPRTRPAAYRPTAGLATLPPGWSGGRVAEGGGLLNRYRGLKPLSGVRIPPAPYRSKR